MVLPPFSHPMDRRCDQKSLRSDALPPESLRLVLAPVKPSSAEKWYRMGSASSASGVGTQVPELGYSEELARKDGASGSTASPEGSGRSRGRTTFRPAWSSCVASSFVPALHLHQRTHDLLHGCIKLIVNGIASNVFVSSVLSPIIFCCCIYTLQHPQGQSGLHQ